MGKDTKAARCQKAKTHDQRRIREALTGLGFPKCC